MGIHLRHSVILALLLVVIGATSPAAAADGAARWRQEAIRTEIIRDDWGIAHVHGKTDADAVFGMAYAQAEDDFDRVEANYLTALGRTAETEGEKAIYADLRQKLFIDPEVLNADYANSPAWLKALMNAWADGLNYYLATHPNVTPRAIKRFEPWMALSFTEGSIGGDIERVPLDQLKAFYGDGKLAVNGETGEPGASNGIAIAPAITKDGHALLLINPHTSFFFRSELQMSSDDGLDAYGAVTWGQFFVYQGFNEHVGWMHTSTGADNVDEFAETIVRKSGRLYYVTGRALRPVGIKIIKVPYRTTGGMAAKTFTTYLTRHGPVIRTEGSKWISIALLNKPVAALEQSWLHPEVVPKRDDRFDFTKPVDGADQATDWKGLTALGDLPHLLNPPQRMDRQHQQLALFCSGALRAEARGFSEIHGHRRGEPARAPRHTLAHGQQGLDARIACRRSLRALSARFRAPHSHIDPRV